MRFKLRLLTILLIIGCSVQAQENSWLDGTWIGRKSSPNSCYTQKYSLLLTVGMVDDEDFKGTVSVKVHDGLGTRVDYSVFGKIKDNELTILEDEILYKKEPPKCQWISCGYCKTQTSVLINRDTLFIKIETVDCNDQCKSTSWYYKLLKMFDDSTRHYLVNRFGTEQQKQQYAATRVQEKESISPVQPIITSDSILKTPVILSRKKNVLAEYIVNSPEVTLSIYDNGIVDGDTISLYHNGQRILSGKPVSEKPILLKLTLLEDRPVHEFILVAENLGKIPPNTSTLKIISGNKEYTVYAKTNFDENAVIRLVVNKNAGSENSATN